MANVEIPAGSWGSIPPAKRQADGRYKASGRFKTHDGRLIQRNRFGTTARKAEEALLSHFQQMAAEGKKPMAADTTFAEIVEEWIAFAESDTARFRVNTAYEYA